MRPTRSLAAFRVGLVKKELPERTALTLAHSISLLQTSAENEMPLDVITVRGRDRVRHGAEP